MTLSLRQRAALGRWSLWSSFAMAPATWLLLAGGSLAIGGVYLVSLLVTLAYHGSMERKYREIDHVFAYSVIGSNCWMSFWTEDALWTALGILSVAMALAFYRRAHRTRRSYDGWHSLWHLACGLAGWCFARGYLA